MANYPNVINNFIQQSSLIFLLIAVIIKFIATTSSTTLIQYSTETDITLKLLDEASHEISNQYLIDNKDLIIIFGESNDDKSLLLKYITYNYLVNDFLSIKINDNKYKIIDNNKNKVQYLNKSELHKIWFSAGSLIPLYDYPGYYDKKNNSLDIASEYMFKEMVKKALNIKFVLLIDYNVIKNLNETKQFMNQLEQLAKFFVDIYEYQNSIGMIVINVDNDLCCNITEIIANYLENIIKILEKDTQYDFFENGIRFISYLLRMNDDYIYDRISVFRQPDSVGPTDTIKSVRQDTNKINKMIFETMKYSNKSENDFSFSISESSQNVIHNIIDLLNIKININVKNLCIQIEKYLEIDEYIRFDVFNGSESRNEFMKIKKKNYYDVFQSHIYSNNNNKENLYTPAKFIKTLSTIILSHLNLTLLNDESIDNIELLFVQLNKLQNLTKTTNFDIIIYINQWINQFNDLMDYLNNKRCTHYELTSMDYAPYFKSLNLPIPYEIKTKNCNI